MKVSLIISAYKDRGYLDDCIKSAINQNFKDYEIILSSDGNPKLSVFAEKYNILFVVTPKKNHSSALNNAVSKAKGQWIKELHDDDLLTVNCLHDSFAWKGDCDLIYANAVNFTGNSESVYKSPSKVDLVDLLPCVTNPINSSTIFYKRDVFLKVGGFDTKLEYTEDYDFYLNLLTKGYKIGFINSIVSWYRLHSDQQTSHYDDKKRIEIRNYLIKKYKLY